MQPEEYTYTDTEGAVRELQFRTEYQYTDGVLARKADVYVKGGAEDRKEYEYHYFDEDNKFTLVLPTGVKSVTETGLYYLNSRYYDPEICRFINADDFQYVFKKNILNNLFVYCFNQPTLNKDESGNASKRLLAVGVQFEASLGVLTFGAEVIFAKENSQLSIYFFQYKGAGMNTDFLSDMIEVINTASRSLNNVKKLFGYSWSICLLALFHSKSFKPETYAGNSDGFSICLPILFTKFYTKVLYAYGGGYSVGGLGICKKGFNKSIGFSNVKYTDRTKEVQNLIRAVRQSYEKLFSQAKSIKAK